MYSPDFIRFLVGYNIEEYETTQKKEINLNENKMFRYTKFATVPIEVKE